MLANICKNCRWVEIRAWSVKIPHLWLRIWHDGDVPVSKPHQNASTNWSNRYQPWSIKFLCCCSHTDHASQTHDGLGFGSRMEHQILLQYNIWNKIRRQPCWLSKTNFLKYSVHQSSTHSHVVSTPCRPYVLFWKYSAHLGLTSHRLTVHVTAESS